MQTQDMTSHGHLIVRSEIAESTLRLVDAEAESFGKDPYAATQELAATFASLAKNIRAGVAIDLSAHPTQEWDADFEAEFGPKTLANGIPNWTTARHLALAVRHSLSHISEDGDEPHDWQYFSDLSALMADIETAFGA